MINCAFIIFKSCNHRIKESIKLTPGWFCYLNSIHALKTKWTATSIDSNIGVIFFKPVYIIGWWTDTNSFINVHICILECIIDIQNPGSESIHIRDSNVYNEVFRMCHWTVVLIKINALNLRNPIFTVACNFCTCIKTVTFLNTWSNEWT